MPESRNLPVAPTAIVEVLDCYRQGIDPDRTVERTAVKAALAAIDTAARGETNLMPLILDAVRKYATLGEVCDVLRGVFGEYRPSAMF